MAAGETKGRAEAIGWGLGSAAVDEASSAILRSEPMDCERCRETGVDAIHGFRIDTRSWQALTQGLQEWG